MHTQLDEQHILEAMDRFGGSFASALAAAARAADIINYNKLRRAFPEYWERFAELSDAALVGEGVIEGREGGEG